ncbi:hypothetical protein PHLGIDRAFT_249281 [Phlebiopsis gigantea 11061_1 CR5-6]|uniref:Anaphase-promoting complex subunit 4 WD40 domain-containing protein n=1 Tax=Phlebiopsis gigantea (strain 11061_1 CR5-6) TaxID=745531 RepID=A0A0C3S3W3_PHLG1|nr:hypothetical protein PHLGIDRAFT_249281 [Phlebiopsis gigantea 11061_1 CR5-6]
MLSPQAANKWQWAKILDANAAGERRADDNPCCLAFCRDRLAVAYPKSGVKIWLFVKGTWSPQRSINRQNVTSIKFVEDGEGLIGGTADGVLWHCQVPNGTLRAYTFMRTKISALDIDPKGTHALAAQSAGCILVNVGDGDGKGSVVQAYSVDDAEVQNAAAYEFGALFAARGACLLFGTAQGCIMVWDRGTRGVVHGLYLGEEHTVQAVASFDGGQAVDGHVLAGTRQGQLTWFPQPPVDGA